METIDFESKRSNVEAYYEGKLPEEWITQTRIQWVIYGPYEKKISNSFAAGPEMEMAYKNKSVIIYRVKH